ncbi:MAG: hypothetical protein V4582_23890 [Pseudomonadota bacterium]
MIPLFFLVAAILISVPTVVWYGRGPARAKVPAGYLRVALAATAACIVSVFLISAFASKVGIADWSISQALRWLALCAISVCLSLFSPLLIGFGLAKKASTKRAMVLAIALGLVAVVLFGFFFAVFGFLVFLPI